MALIPYSYQTKAVEDVLQAFKSGVQSVLLHSATGSGKTLISAMAIKKIIEITNKRVFFFVHTDVLFESSARGFSEFFYMNDINAISGSTKPRKSAKIHIMTAQLMGARFERKDYKSLFDSNEIGLVVIDETHFGHFDKILDYVYKEHKEIKILGMTATPKKDKNAKIPLASVFQKMVKTVSEMELIKLGQSVPPYVIAPTVDLDGLNEIKFDNMTGDYKSSELSKFIRSKKKIYSQFFELWQQYSQNEKTLAFCADIQHCIDTIEEAKKFGIVAKMVSSAPPFPKKSTKKESEIAELEYQDRLASYNRYQDAVKLGYTVRKENLREWGKSFHLLVNVSVLTTGFDDKSILSIALLTPIGSENKFLQAVARGKRANTSIEKTHYKVFDLGGNIAQHGLPTADRDYPLVLPDLEKKTKGDAPVKTCPACNMVVPAISLFCSAAKYDDNFEVIGYCGHKFEPKTEVVKDAEFKMMTWDELQQNETEKKKFDHEKIVSKLFKIAGGRHPNWIYYAIHEQAGFEKCGLSGFEHLAKIKNRPIFLLFDDIMQANVKIDLLPYIELLKTVNLQPK